MKRTHLFLLTAFLLALVTGFFSSCQSDSDQEKIAVLVTDWGTPDGMDFNYYSQIGHRSRVGIEATAEDGQCEEDFNGVFPYRSFHGVYPHFLAFNTPGWEFVFDGFGIYWEKNDEGVYVSIYDENLTTTDEEIAEKSAEVGKEISVDPASSITFGRGRAIFTPDTRGGSNDGTPDGKDHLEDMVIIGVKGYNSITCKDAYSDFGNGISDMNELDMAYWWRTIRMLGIREFEGEAAMNPFYDLVDEKLTEYFATFYGDSVDIRFGNYEAVAGLTERLEDVAVDFADEGFTKMVLTRETSDNNDYANVSMTRHWVDYGLCQAGYGKEDVDIAQVKQIGRTPEYNTMVGNILQQHLERLTPGDKEVAIAYTTYGNPWPGTSPDITLASAVSHPWVSDVYPENAYYNYLSFKRYAEDRFGDYNLLWSRPDTTDAEEDFRKNNYYSYAMFQKEFYTPEYNNCTPEATPEAEYKNVRENIDRMKADGVKTGIFLLSHWYFDSIDNGLAQRDVQQLPMNSYEDLENNKFWIHWCEDPTPGNNTWTAVSPENFECPEGDILLVYTECFDNFKEEMIAGYAQRIRGGVERHGVMPKLGITVEARGEITKLGGGEVEIESGSRAGAKIVVPKDPDPDAPEGYYPILDEREINYETINDPSIARIGAWFDFTLAMGEQKNVTPDEALPLATGAVGPAVYIGPYRTLFNKPARVTLPYRADEVSDANTIKPLIFNDLTKSWDAIYPVASGEKMMVDTTNHTVSFDTQVLGIFVLAAN